MFQTFTEIYIDTVGCQMNQYHVPVLSGKIIQQALITSSPHTEVIQRGHFKHLSAEISCKTKHMQEVYAADIDLNGSRTGKGEVHLSEDIK